MRTQNQKQYYLVINLGLRSIRTILFNARTKKIVQNWYPVQTWINQDAVEQDPREWWALCLKLLEEIFKDNQEYRDHLKFITFTSSACCLVVLDQKGEPLINALMVSDKRSKDEAEALGQDPRFQEIFTNPNCLPVASYMFPKILWIKKYRPEVFRKAFYFMSSNDFFIYKLSGKILTDPLNAEKFYFDLNKGRYPEKLLNFVGLKTKNLPRVVNPGFPAGSLVPALRKKFGLSPKVKVVVATYDAICAFLGSGTCTEGEACNVCGTVSSVRAYTKKKIHCQGGILAQKYGHFNIVGGSNNIDGGLLEWAKDMFYGDSYPEKYVYKIMEDEARETPMSSRGLIFSPYIIGERLPFFDNVARGIFFGLERFHKRNDIMRSIFEASGFMINDIIKNIEASGLKVKTIRMSGGMARNGFLCKIRADITGKKVIVLEEVETTALGALFILLIAAGVYKNFQEAAKTLKIKAIYKPSPQNHKKYKKLFSLFKKIYESNRSLMQERELVLRDLIRNKKYILDNL